MGSSGEIVGGEALLAKMNAVPALLRSRIEQAVTVGAGMIETTAKENIRANQSVVTGNLFQSVGTVMKREEGEISALVGSALGYAAGYEFGVAVEEGNFDTHEFYLAILDWVRIKRIGGNTPEEQETTAYFITEHIRQYGTKPHPFLIPAYQQHQAEIKRLLERVVGTGGGESVS